jgi:hypothetical protein
MYLLVLPSEIANIATTMVVSLTLDVAARSRKVTVDRVESS